MGMFNVFNISGSAMTAESIRLNLSASNIANKNNVYGSEPEAYRAQKPLFKLSKDGGVEVKEIVESKRNVQKIYNPNHILADENGLVYGSNVNDEEEMADIISASKNYEMNAQVISNIKQMMLKTIQM
jgi:flagellar basal-body rod protein FlgC